MKWGFQLLPSGPSNCQAHRRAAPGFSRPQSVGTSLARHWRQHGNVGSPAHSRARPGSWSSLTWNRPAQGGHSGCPLGPWMGCVPRCQALVRQAGLKCRIRRRWQGRYREEAQSRELRGGWSLPSLMFFLLFSKTQTGQEAALRWKPLSEAGLRHGELGTRAGPTLQGHLTTCHTSQPRLSPQESMTSVTLQETGWLVSYPWSHGRGTPTPAECPADSQHGMGDTWHH